MSEPTAATGRFYLPELDVIRLVAFVLVFLSHVVPGEPEFYRSAHIPKLVSAVIVDVSAGGAFGVDLFFALSSFLLTTLLRRERLVTGRIDVGAFYWRRVLRIWPLYFGFLLVVLPLVGPFVPGEDLPARDAVAFLLLVGNWAFVLWGYPHSVIGPLWSVCMEEQFYLGWPLLLRSVGAHAWRALVWVWVISALVRLGWVWMGAVHPQIWCNTLAHLDSIAGGGLLALVVSKRPMAIRTWVRLVLMCCGVGVFAAAARYGGFVGARSLLTYPAVAVAACVIIAASLHPRTERLAGLKPLVYLGKISYGLYVFHMVFIMLLGVRGASTPGRRVALIAATFLCTVVAAALSYQLYERPFLGLKRRFTYIASGPV